MAEPVVRSGAVTVMVRDVEHALRFYTHVLGLHLRASHSGPEFDWAEVEAPGITLVLEGADRPAAREEGPPPAALSVGFDVESLDEAMRVLRGRGVVFAPEVFEDAELRIAWFTDVDGTPLFLRERKR